MKITRRQLRNLINEAITPTGILIVDQVNQLKGAYFILDPERNYDQQSKMEQQQVVERIKSEMNPRDFKIALRLAYLYVEYVGTDFGYGANFSPEEEALWSEAELLGSKIGVSAQQVFS